MTLLKPLELGRECFCPFRTLKKRKGSGSMLSVFYLGTLPWGKGLGFIPLGLSCPKCEECPRPSKLYSSKFKILYIENFSTMLGISRHPEPLCFWPQIKRYRIPDKNEKSVHLLGLLQLSEGISPLPAEGFMVPQTYNQPWGSSVMYRENSWWQGFQKVVESSGIWVVSWFDLSLFGSAMYIVDSSRAFWGSGPLQGSWDL